VLGDDMDVGIAHLAQQCAHDRAAQEFVQAAMP